MTNDGIKRVPVGGIGEFTPDEVQRLVALTGTQDWPVFLKWLACSDTANGVTALCQTTSHEACVRLQGETVGNRKASQMRQNAVTALKQLQENAKK